MEDWIAGAMLVLGSLLVLSGGAVIVLRALGPAEPAGAASPAPAAGPGWPSVPAAAPAPASPSGPAGDRGSEPLPANRRTRLAAAVRRMPAADRLIAWGIVLLVLGAVAAGAISFSLGASAGTR